jgi:uncharacterized protein YjbI with pentapeptide repeats
VRVADDFFKLPGSPTDILSEEFAELVKQGGAIKGRIYRPDTLSSAYAPSRWRIRNCQFQEMSFSRTLIDGIEFENCDFDRCLFVGASLKNCRFTDCKFINCNMYRVEFSNVYLNPTSFDRCLDQDKYQNIGVHLYQELLNNCRQQSQPDFTQHALFEFRRWLRFQYFYDLKQEGADWKTRLNLVRLIFANFAAQYLLGFGVKLRNYAMSALAIILLLAFLNFQFADEFGLKFRSWPHSLADAVYFTVITLTTTGYGDITPSESVGRLFVAAEGLIGFVLFATLASMIYRKILP